MVACPLARLSLIAPLPEGACASAVQTKEGLEVKVSLSWIQSDVLFYKARNETHARIAALVGVSELEIPAILQQVEGCVPNSATRNYFELLQEARRLKLLHPESAGYTPGPSDKSEE